MCQSLCGIRFLHLLCPGHLFIVGSCDAKPGFPAESRKTLYGIVMVSFFLQPVRVLRFLHYQILHDNDFILATMQSAGTHWLRFMIAKAIVNFFDLDYQFKNIHPISVVPGFSLKAPSQFIYQQRSEIPRVQQTHFRYVFPWSIFFRCKRSIVLVRDLRDALASHYRKALRQGQPEILAMSFLEFLMDEQGIVRKTSVQGSLGGRVEFLNSWGTAHAKRPTKVLVIRYEDLMVDPSCVLKQVMNFLGIEVDDLFVERVVEFSSLENMKLLGEKAMKSGEGKGMQEIMAVNKGVVGSFRELWVPEVEEYFQNYISRHLRYDFGYHYG